MRFVSKYSFANISFPASMRDFATFKKQNKNIAINVFGVDEEDSCVSVLRLSKKNDQKCKRIHRPHIPPLLSKKFFGARTFLLYF